MDGQGEARRKGGGSDSPRRFHLWPLHALAPTQTEPPFKLTQLIVLLVSVLLAIVAAIRFHPEPIRTA